MKTIETKHSNKGLLIGAIATGAAVAGGLAWLLLTDQGKKVSEQALIFIKDKAADVLAAQLDKRTALSHDDAAAGAGAIIG